MANSSTKFKMIVGMVVSFVVASMLNVYPLHHTLASMRPMFLVMVMMFWVMYRSSMMGVWSVFFVGLMSDLLLGTHLGHQAFCATLTTLVLRIIMIYTKELTMWQSWIIASIGLIVYQGVLWILQAFSHAQFVWLGFGSLLSSMVFFPVVWSGLIWINRYHQERSY